MSKTGATHKPPSQHMQARTREDDNEHEIRLKKSFYSLILNKKNLIKVHFAFLTRNVNAVDFLLTDFKPSLD